jgi:hypothetical protein
VLYLVLVLVLVLELVLELVLVLVLVLVLEPRPRVGRAGAGPGQEEQDIQLSGAGIQQEHCRLEVRCTALHCTSRPGAWRGAGADHPPRHQDLRQWSRGEQAATTLSPDGHTTKFPSQKREGPN